MLGGETQVWTCHSGASQGSERAWQLLAGPYWCTAVSLLHSRTLNCTRTNKNYFTCFSPLGKQADQPFALRAEKGYFCNCNQNCSSSSEMRSLLRQTLSKHRLKRYFQLKSRGGYRQLGREQGLEHPTLCGPQGTNKWLVWSGTIWRRNCWRAQRYREVYRREEMPPTTRRGNFMVAFHKSVAIFHRKGKILSEVIKRFWACSLQTDLILGLVQQAQAHYDSGGNLTPFRELLPPHLGFYVPRKSF